MPTMPYSTIFVRAFFSSRIFHLSLLACMYASASNKFTNRCAVTIIICVAKYGWGVVGTRSVHRSLKIRSSAAATCRAMHTHHYSLAFLRHAFTQITSSTQVDGHVALNERHSEPATSPIIKRNERTTEKSAFVLLDLLLLCIDDCMLRVASKQFTTKACRKGP